MLNLILNQVSIAAAGFSFIALLLLLLQKRMESKLASRYAVTLLSTLILIQLLQVYFINSHFLIEGTIAFIYLLLLGLVGPLFYLYTLSILKYEKLFSYQDLYHIASIIIFAAVFLLIEKSFSFVYAAMFVIGGIYMLKLIWSLYQLRNRRTLFKLEFMVTTCFLGWAILIVLFSLINNPLTEILIPSQIIMLALSIASALYIQLNFPHLLSTLEEIGNRSYQSSTLEKLDCAQLKQQLNETIVTKKGYENCDLNLSSLAEQLSVKPYQLTEFLNTQLNMSFSSYLRNQRICAAEILLKSEPTVSVLAIGLAVGFNSQSAFYSAFRQIHAMAPGQYRKQLLAE